MSEGFCFRQSDFSLCRKLITTCVCELSGIFKVKLLPYILRRKKCIEDVDGASCFSDKQCEVITDPVVVMGFNFPNAALILIFSSAQRVRGAPEELWELRELPQLHPQQLACRNFSDFSPKKHLAQSPSSWIFTVSQVRTICKTLWGWSPIPAILGFSAGWVK